MKKADVMINLDNAWKITLENSKGKTLTQYFEGETMDKAIDIAKNSFLSRLYDFDSGIVAKAAQKACDKTLERKPYRFGFCGGWTTIYPVDGGETIHSMLKRAAESEWVKGKAITEIDDCR